MRTAVLICCCLALVACTVAPTFKPNTSVTTPAVGRPSPPSSVQAAVSGEAFTPYDGLGQSNDDGLAPSESFSSLSKACLTDAGFPNATGLGAVVVIGGPGGPGGLEGQVPFGRWGYLGAAEAAQDGFAFRFRGPGFAAAPGAASGPPSAAEQKAMNKCDTIAGKFIESQMSAALAGIRTLSNDIITDVQRDPSVKAAAKAWSACMAQNGYNITDPQTAFVKALQAGGGPTGNPAQTKTQKQAQIAMAITDADCTESTDLAGIYFAVQASYEQQLVSTNQQALNAAVQEYRVAYQKEMSQLPKLLSTTKG